MPHLSPLLPAHTTAAMHVIAIVALLLLSLCALAFVLLLEHKQPPLRQCSRNLEKSSCNKGLMVGAHEASRP
jgi:hypothetical protein